MKSLLRNSLVVSGLALAAFATSSVLSKDAEASGVATTKNVPVTFIYTKAGNQVRNRGLMANTPWRVGKIININGETMYQVATNEYLKASDSTLSGNTASTPTNQDGVVTIKINYLKRSTNTNNSFIIKSETRRVKLNSTVTINALKFDGYTVVPGEETWTGPVQFDGETFTIPYTKDGEGSQVAKNGMVTIRIDYLKRSTNTNDSYIIKTEARNVMLNSNITIDAPKLSGYTVVPGEETWTGPIQFAGEVFTIPYNKNVVNTLSAN